MKLQTLIEWDGPFPSDVATAHFNNLRVTCLTPGYQVHRYEHKGIWLKKSSDLEISSLMMVIPWHYTK